MIFLLLFPISVAVGDSSDAIGQIVNCNYRVNVRSGPGTSYSKIGTAPKGTTYTVTGQTGSWYQIDYNGQTAYIYSRFIEIISTDDSGDDPGNNSTTGQIVNCNYYVNVRSGPSTQCAKIGTVPKGETYTILGTAGSWYKIEYNELIGYVYGRYLKIIIPITTPTPTPEVSDTVITGYYASWAAYEGYTPLSIPADKLTHINYAFANISSDLEITMGDPNIDPENFEKLQQLKQQYPHIKTLISVGGWLWSGSFSDVALTEESRTAFANSVVAFIKQYGFDGVDIDWEFPVEGGMEGNVTRPEDKTNFTLLMAKLREKLDEQGSIDGCHYLLSFAGACTSYYANTVELEKLTAYVDYAKLMCYDMHGSWDSYTDFNAPLYMPQEETPQFKWSCEDAVDLWINSGFEQSKIVMGIPLYGNVYTGVYDANNGLYQTYGSCTSVSYDDIVSQYLNGGYNYYLHDEARVPWLFNGSTFVSYDDAQSIAEKADFVKNKGIGGAAVWELSQNANGELIETIYDNLK